MYKIDKGGGGGSKNRSLGIYQITGKDNFWSREVGTRAPIGQGSQAARGPGGTATWPPPST